MATSFGIHVGNTSVCLAVSKDGKTDVVAAPTGDRVTPAVVGFTDSEIIVGLPAKQGRLRNLGNTVTNNKRVLAGKSNQEEFDANPVTITKDGSKIFYEVEYKEKEWKTSPRKVAEHIFRYIHDIAASHCSAVDESNCVLTVPLDFKKEERDEVASAASEVGFKVIQVISEPAAACLAYGLGQLDQGDREVVLVFRAGGLSTDLTLVLVAGGCYSVLESVRVEGLGGHQVTEVLVKFLGGEFKQKYKEDILQSRKGKAKLQVQAENVKHILSTLDTAHCYVESLFDGMDFSSNVTRARFDNQLAPVLTELLAPCSLILTKAGLVSNEITKVLLVGGTTKVVKLQSALASTFPKAELLSTIAPDEVIAFGAAVQASNITSSVEPGVKEKVMTVAKGITARVVGGEDVPLIVAYSPIPIKRSVPVVAFKDAEKTVVELVFGEKVVMGSLTIPSSLKSKLQLSLHIHRDGSSHAVLQDKSSNSSVDLVLSIA